MYQLLGIMAIGVFAWLSNEENKARANYYAKKQTLQEEIMQQQMTCRSLQTQANKTLARRKAIELYKASKQTANTHYAIYGDHKNLVRLVGEKERMLRTRIMQLKEQRDSLPHRKQKEIRKELSQVRQCFQEAKAEREQLCSQKSRLLEQLRTINRQTREFRLLISHYSN